MRFWWIGVLVLALVVAGCVNSGSSPGSGSKGLSGKLVLTGSSTVAPLAGELAKRFEAEYPNVRVDVQTGGSSRGIADARRGVADIGMVSRALKASEDDLHGHLVAFDGIGMIVHANNPVTELSAKDIVAIYRGEIENWQAVGGKAAPITVVHKAQGRSTLEVFLAHFGLENTEVEASVIIGDNEQGIKTVANDPNALGYVSVGAAEFSAGEGVTIRLLPMEGVEASTANIANGRFPLSRELNYVTAERPKGLAKKFIEFSQSGDVHDQVRKLYFVPAG